MNKLNVEQVEYLISVSEDVDRQVLKNMLIGFICLMGDMTPEEASLQFWNDQESSCVLLADGRPFFKYDASQVIDEEFSYLGRD